MKPRILIAGAGIAGLTAALALHARGYSRIRLVERSLDVQPLGSGINLMPLAVRELDGLGLLDSLLPLCIQTGELFYMTHRGDRIWHEVRGRAAGFAWPQLSIHRGWLQMQLYQRVIELLGPEAVITGQEVVGIESNANGQTVICHDRRHDGVYRHEADLVIGADGIRSAVRRLIAPADDAPVANGMVIFRGTLWSKPFLSGKSMIIAGDGVRKFVVYPMAHSEDGSEVLLNWAAAAPESTESGYDRGDWNLPLRPSSFAFDFKGWKIAGIEPAAIMLNSKDTFVYPMVDLEPLARWTRDDAVVLIGDAAHAMYPIGSNGATQSIVDACALAHHLDSQATLAAALAAYEADRRPKMTALQTANRRQGPEVVIDIANQRAPSGFGQADEVFAPGELDEIASRYVRASAMDLQQLNQPSIYWPPGSTALLRTQPQQQAELQDA